MIALLSLLIFILAGVIWSSAAGLATNTVQPAEDGQALSVDQVVITDSTSGTDHASNTGQPPNRNQPTDTASQSPESDTSPSSGTAIPGHPGLSMEASFGYDGVITYLRKLPLRVTLYNDSPNSVDFAGVLAMNVFRNERQYDRYELPVTVAAGAVVEAEMLVELTMRQARYEVELLVNDKPIATHPLPHKRLLNPATLLIGTLGGQSLTHFHITSGRDPLKRGELWQTIPLTEKTFPRDEASLRTFAVLAMDGFDARTLDLRQQKALDTWLKNGGIVIVGGAAQAGSGYPYFEKYTGITAGAPFLGEDVTPAILSWLKSAEKPHGEEMMLVKIWDGKNTVVGAEATLAGERAEIPLIDVCTVRQGYVMTIAFSLSDKPLTTWQGNMVLWQRIMLAAVGGHYRQVMDAQANYYGRGYEYINESILSGIEVRNDSSFAAPLVLLIAFVLLVGLGSYMVLKKKDKREWMWVSIPLFSILFAVGFLLISNGSVLKQPVLVVSDYISQSAEGVVTEKASVSVAVDERRPVFISVEEGEITHGADGSFYYGEMNVSTPPAELRYTHWLGSPSGMIFPGVQPWRAQSLLVKGTNPPQLNVNGSCWFEEDGLHIRLKNEGTLTLSKGHVITSYGYCSAEELLPGQSADYLIKNADAATRRKVQSFNGNGNCPILDGVLFTKEQQVYNEIYSLISAIAYPELWTDSDKPVSITQKEYGERVMLHGMYDQMYGIWESSLSVVFHYVTFNDSICQIPFRLDGQTVRRTAQANILDVELAYQPVSPNGYVKYAKGTVPVYTAALDSENIPRQDTQITERYRYFRLTDKPAFCFILPPEARGMDVSGAELAPRYIYGDYAMYVFNHKTREWDELNRKADMKKQLDLKTHLSEEGELFVLFEPALTTDTYADMETPYLTMEGGIR